MLPFVQVLVWGAGVVAGIAVDRKGVTSAS